MTQAASHDRLEREVAYFEAHYRDEAGRGVAPLSEFDRRRYTAPPAGTVYPREFYYHLLAPLKGKKVMEMACGNGIDACIMAHNGADVHAYDISSESTRLVRQRAQANDLSDRIQLQVTGDFDQAYAGETFDHIVGYAAIHHIPMEGLAQRVYDRLKPGGCAVFAEPVINSQALYALRRCVPYYFWKPTEDEKPLCDADIQAFARPFDRVQQREFQLVSRIWPMFRQSWTVTAALHHLDGLLLRFPVMRRFATVSVFALHRDR